VLQVVGAVGLALYIHSSRAEPPIDDKEVAEPIESAPARQDAGNVDRRLVTANTRFGFKLYSDLRNREPGKNTFVSPASVAMALAMTYNGAGAETKTAMARALEVDSVSLDELNRGFSALRAALASSDPKVKLEIANSLWGKQGVAFKPDFIDRNRRFFGAEVTNLDFGDPGAPGKINSWVKQKTHDKIDKIVDEIDPMTVLYLINAIYFKGAWSDEFKKTETKDEPFKAMGGDVRVPMMHQSDSYQHLDGKDFQAVSLPYGSGRVSMYVFLPSENSSLAEFQKSLTAENWDQWMTQFKKTPGDIGLPRFKLEFEATLNDTLKAMGMEIAFDPDRADFSGIADGDRIYISRVKHKSFCEVNEEGTEAAAVTSVEMRTTSAMRPQKRFRMIVDRPFFFAIRDNQTGSVLFMGSVVKP
jgi:serpin B